MAVSVAAVACRDKRIGTDSQTFMGKLRERREGKIHSRNHCLSCALKHSTIPSATSLGVEYHPSGCGGEGGSSDGPDDEPLDDDDLS